MLTSQAWYARHAHAHTQTSELLVEPEVAEAALVKSSGDVNAAFGMLLRHASVQ